MKNKRSIGALIEKEVRSQQFSIVDFANKICCKRNNVYDIFKRSKIDIEQLALISKVLNRNFFKDLADDITLICQEEESATEAINREAFSFFLQVAPKILKELGADSTIVYAQGYEAEENIPVPDLMLPDYFITLTIGESLQERANGFYHPELISIQSLKSEQGAEVDIWHNRLHNSVSIDIKLNKKTEEEWFQTLKFALEIYNNLNNR